MPIIRLPTDTRRRGKMTQLGFNKMLKGMKKRRRGRAAVPVTGRRVPLKMGNQVRATLPDRHQRRRAWQLLRVKRRVTRVAVVGSRRRATAARST
jgi:hypothetical protein